MKIHDDKKRGVRRKKILTERGPKNRKLNLEVHHDSATVPTYAWDYHYTTVRRQQTAKAAGSRQQAAARWQYCGGNLFEAVILSSAR